MHPQDHLPTHLQKINKLMAHLNNTMKRFEEIKDHVVIKSSSANHQGQV